MNQRIKRKNPRNVDFNLYSFIGEDKFKSLLRDLNMYVFIFNNLKNKNKFEYKFVKGEEGSEYSHMDLKKNKYVFRFYFIFDYLVIDIIDPKSNLVKSFLNPDGFEICKYLENLQDRDLSDAIYSYGLKDNKFDEDDFSLPCRIKSKNRVNFSFKKSNYEEITLLSINDIFDSCDKDATEYYLAMSKIGSFIRTLKPENREKFYLVNYYKPKGVNSFRSNIHIVIDGYPIELSRLDFGNIYGESVLNTQSIISDIYIKSNKSTDLVKFVKDAQFYGLDGSIFSKISTWNDRVESPFKPEDFKSDYGIDEYSEDDTAWDLIKKYGEIQFSDDPIFSGEYSGTYYDVNYLQNKECTPRLPINVELRELSIHDPKGNSRSGKFYFSNLPCRIK